MKINEIVNESQLDEIDWRAAASAGKEFLQKGLAGGGIGAAKAKYNDVKTANQNNAQAAKTTEQISKITNAVLNAWTVQIKTLQNAGAPVTKQNFIEFMKKETPSLNPPSDADFPSDADVIDPAKFKPYITRSIAQHFANRQNNVNSPAPAAPTTAPKSKWVPSRTVAGLGQIEVPDGRLFIKNSRGWVLQHADPSLPGTQITNIDQITALENLKAKLDGTAIPTESVQR